MSKGSFVIMMAANRLHRYEVFHVEQYIACIQNADLATT